MNSRQRTFLALEHRAADRIPIDFWATSSVIQNLERMLGKPYTAFLDDYDVDFRYIEGPAYIGPTLDQGVDIWGVGRSTVFARGAEYSESYAEVAKAPLDDAESPADIESYGHWPDADMFDYDVVKQQCDDEIPTNSC